MAEDVMRAETASKVRLGVNVDHVATVRNARGGKHPDPVRAAKAAMAAGGNDNGPPGPRPHYHENYYGAFVLDPDGHNIEAVCHLPA